MALRFVSSLLGEKNPHKNIGTVGALSIQGEGGGEGPRAHGVTCELFFKYGGEGGMDSLRSPCGQPVRYALRLSNWLSPVVEPSVEDSHPSRRHATCEKKARIFMRALL